MKDSKLTEGGLGKKRDIRLAKRFIKDLQGVDTPAAKEFKALMNEVLAGGYKPVKKKDGGLAEAIEKVKAKEMQGGGEAKSGGKAVSINTPTGRRKMAEIRKIMPGASVDEVKEFGLKAGILKMKEGGEAVPPKFKGFSKLPESVQQKMNPDLAEKFGMGGDVKGKKSRNICRGRGIARPGTGFTIR